MRIVTLSFDDGFEKSNVEVARLYEKYGLSACFNIVASAHLPEWVSPDTYVYGLGDFSLWNELQARGHEIMPHGYRHARKTTLSFEEGRDLTLRCLDIFDRELSGFDRRRAVYNFPFNDSTPELEAWLPTVVRAFRTMGKMINPLPERSTVKLATGGFGPGNGEAVLDEWIEKLLAQRSGWLIYNTHGLDNEGWGPIGSDYLDRLLARLVETPDVRVMPAGRALMMADAAA